MCDSMLMHISNAFFIRWSSLWNNLMYVIFCKFFHAWLLQSLFWLWISVNHSGLPQHSSDPWNNIPFLYSVSWIPPFRTRLQGVLSGPLQRFTKAKHGKCRCLSLYIIFSQSDRCHVLSGPIKGSVPKKHYWLLLKKKQRMELKSCKMVMKWSRSFIGVVGFSKHLTSFCFDELDKGDTGLIF